MSSVVKLTCYCSVFLSQNKAKLPIPITVTHIYCIIVILPPLSLSSTNSEMTIFNTFSHNESLQIPNWTKKSQMPLFVQVGQSYSSYFVSIITTGSPRHRRSTFFPFVQNVTLHATGTRPVHPLVWPYVTIISFLGSNEKQSNPRRNGIQHGGQNIATTWHRSKWKQCENVLRVRT